MEIERADVSEFVFQAQKDGAVTPLVRRLPYALVLPLDLSPTH